MSKRQPGSLASRIDAFDCVAGDYGDLTRLVTRRLSEWRVPEHDAADLAQGLVTLAWQTGSLPCRTVDRAAWAWLARRRRAREVPMSQLAPADALPLHERTGTLDGSIWRLAHADAPARPEQAVRDVDSWDAIHAALAEMRRRGWDRYADRLGAWIKDPHNPPPMTQMQRQRTLEALRRALLPLLPDCPPARRRLKAARKQVNDES